MSPLEDLAIWFSDIAELTPTKAYEPNFAACAVNRADAVHWDNRLAGKIQLSFERGKTWAR
jgi:hypothetical protein